MAAVFEITYKKNDGSGTEETCTNSSKRSVDYITSVGQNWGQTPQDWSRDGFSFKHWNTSADDSGLSYNGGDIYLGSIVTLYAIWQADTPVGADVSVTLGNTEIASLSDTGSVTLATAGTYVNEDITIDYTKSGGGVSPSGSLNITNNGTYDITNYAEVVVSVSVPIEYIDYTYTVSGSTETWNLGKSPNQIKALLDQGKIVFVQIPSDGSYTQVFGCTRSSSSASTYRLIYIEKIYEGGSIYSALKAIPSYTANGINGTFSYSYTSGGSND